MNLYLITRTKKYDLYTYHDAYHSAVVCARNEAEAALVHPHITCQGKWWTNRYALLLWVPPEFVEATCIGVAADHIDCNQVICARR